MIDTLPKKLFTAAFFAAFLGGITWLFAKAYQSGDEPYGEEGKYKLVFSEKAKPIGPIPFGDAVSGLMQGPRYTTFAQLKSAEKLTDLFSKA